MGGREIDKEGGWGRGGAEAEAQKININNTG